MEAQNLAGYGIPSIPVSVMPSPVCDAETLGGGTDGNLKFQGGLNVYLYFELLGLPEPKGPVIGVTDQTSGIKHITVLAGAPAIEVLWFQKVRILQSAGISPMNWNRTRTSTPRSPQAPASAQRGDVRASRRGRTQA